MPLVRAGTRATEVLPGILIVVAAIVAVLLRLIGGNRNALRRRRHPVGLTAGIAVVDAAILREIVLAFLTRSLRVLVMLVQVVERRRARQNHHLLLGR